VVGKAAPECRVDLLDAVGNPNGRDGVGFEDLVHPGLAADTAVARRCDLFGAGQDLRRLTRNRRENILDLVKQQR
jgi:hypothetical protein